MPDAEGPPPPPQHDLEAMRTALEAWHAGRMPEASDVHVSELERPASTGYSNDTLLFDLSWQTTGVNSREGRVVRLEPRGVTVFPHYDLGLQARILEKLAPTDVPVPRVFGFEPDAAVLGAPFYVMERVEGRIPTDNPPYHMGGWVTEIEPDEREALWWSGLDVLVEIHRLDWRELDLFEPPRQGETPLARELAAYERFLTWAARGRPQPTAEAGLAWLRKHVPEDDEPVVFSWGDARPGNMIFREGRCVAVLDWEMADLRSPESDLAWWLFLDRHHSEGVGRERLPGFPTREETVARYEKATDHRVRHLHYYEVFAAFRFAVIMIRVAQQLVAAKLLPPDSEFETDNIVTRLLAKLLEEPDA